MPTSGALRWRNGRRFAVLTASQQEITAHEARLRAIQEKIGHCLWNDL